MDTFYPPGYLASNKDGYLLSTFQGFPARKQNPKGMELNKCQQN
jgi:hypothetical protein